MTKLTNKKLMLTKFFNLRKDPYELNNLFNYKKNISHQILNKLLKNFYKERKNIFKIRGINSFDKYLKTIKLIFNSLFSLFNELEVPISFQYSYIGNTPTL